MPVVIPPGTPAAKPVTPAIPPKDAVDFSVNSKTGEIGKAPAFPTIPSNIPQTRTVVSEAKNPTPGGGQVFLAKPTKVIDGDTVRFGDVICRIKGIDAPEVAHKQWTDKKGKVHKANPDQEYGLEAKNVLMDMIDNREISVTVTKASDDGERSICQLDLHGKSIPRRLIELGAAQVYERYGTTSDDLIAQRDAKLAKKGLWANLNQESGEEFRKRYQK